MSLQQLSFSYKNVSLLKYPLLTRSKHRRVLLGNQPSQDTGWGLKQRNGNDIIIKREDVRSCHCTGRFHQTGGGESALCPPVASIYDKYPYGKPQTDEVARGSGNREYGCRRLREKLPNFSGVSFFRAGNSSNRVNAFHICVYVHRCAVPRYIALQYP